MSITPLPVSVALAPFSTKDQNNDPYARYYAVIFKGGWWHSTVQTIKIVDDSR